MAPALKHFPARTRVSILGKCAFCGNYLLGDRATFQTETSRPTLWHMDAHISKIVTRAE